jgi:hypothetical protein
MLECCQAIALHIVSFDTQESPCLARVRRQNPIIAPPGARLGNQIKRIGIHHQRLSRPEYRFEGLACPVGSPQPWTYRYNIRTLNRLIEPGRIGQREADELRPTGRNSHHVLGCNGDCDQPCPDAQTGLSSEPRRARVSGAAAHNQDATEIALVGRSTPTGQSAEDFVLHDPLDARLEARRLWRSNLQVVKKHSPGKLRSVADEQAGF